jgi:hypothetical protein
MILFLLLVKRNKEKRFVDCLECFCSVRCVFRVLAWKKSAIWEDFSGVSDMFLLRFSCSYIDMTDQQVGSLYIYR